MKRMMWWGSWMVPSLALQRKRRKAVPGEPVDVTYLRYLRTPPWPLSGLVKLAFAWDHGRTLRERNHTGTSLLAVAGPERAEV